MLCNSFAIPDYTPSWILDMMDESNASEYINRKSNFDVSKSKIKKTKKTKKRKNSMVLKTKKANKLVIDNDGYIEAIIKSFDDSDKSIVKGKSLIEISDSISWEFQSVGNNGKKITIFYNTGNTINPEKMDDGFYNKLTDFSIAMGLIDESKLNELSNDIELDAESILGKKIKFQVEKSRKKSYLYVPIKGSFSLIEG